MPHGHIKIRSALSSQDFKQEKHPNRLNSSSAHLRLWHNEKFMPLNPENPKKNHPRKDSALITCPVQLIFFSNLIYLPSITIKPQSSTWLSAGQIKWLLPCKDPIPKGAKWTLSATNCWQYPHQHTRGAVMGTQISQRVETLLISCPTQTHRLTSKQPAQWDNVLGTSFFKAQEFSQAGMCDRTWLSKKPKCKLTTINPSCLPPAVSAPSLTSFGGLNHHQEQRFWIYFASCWLPGLVPNWGGGTPKSREQTHPITSFCSTFLQILSPVILSQAPAGVHRECCSTGRNLSWNCYVHKEMYYSNAKI